MASCGGAPQLRWQLQRVARACQRKLKLQPVPVERCGVRRAVLQGQLPPPSERATRGYLAPPRRCRAIVARACLARHASSGAPSLTGLRAARRAESASQASAVLRLYRRCLQSALRCPTPDNQEYMTFYARNTFRGNARLSDPRAIARKIEVRSPPCVGALPRPVPVQPHRSFRGWLPCAPGQRHARRTLRLLAPRRAVPDRMGGKRYRA